MNAKLLEQFVAYREKHGICLAKLFLSKKIKYQFAVIGKRNIAAPYIIRIAEGKAVAPLFLVEARAAKEYWKFFGERLNGKIAWYGRLPRGRDPANKFLDIGYHYVAGTIIKLCNAVRLPSELGILHKAQSSGAHPLVYDFMEWLRPFVVERTFAALMRKKKREVFAADGKSISRFVGLLKQKLNEKYYHKELHYCIPLRYWIRLMLLQLMKSIASQKQYSPCFPTLRHESRCKKPPGFTEAA